MALIETVKCDQCGAIKGEGNHWLTMDVCAALSPGQVIHIGYSEQPGGCERRDLCGQACFHKHLDALLFPEKKAVDFDAEQKILKAQHDNLTDYLKRNAGIVPVD